ncbi:MAG: response regulator, partial [Coleofasciculus sp. S288]|nr:response regulator [Coleofasciculus sp. S288]
MLETNKKQILYSQEGSDDLLLIEDELESVQPEDNWKVLVVDDEVEIHNVTQLALKNFTFERKPLCLISAYSTEQAKQLIQSHPDIALVLLDVVMEKDNSGLDVVNYIRSSLKNDSVQIILRTGQPGKCPENRVIFNYAINDYKTKTELTKSKLVTALVTALRTYGAMTKLDSSKAQMEKRAEESKKLYQKSKNYS